VLLVRDIKELPLIHVRISFIIVSKRYDNLPDIIALDPGQPEPNLANRTAYPLGQDESPAIRVGRNTCRLRSVSYR